MTDSYDVPEAAIEGWIQWVNIDSVDPISFACPDKTKKKEHRELIEKLSRKYNINFTIIPYFGGQIVSIEHFAATKEEPDNVAQQTMMLEIIRDSDDGEVRINQKDEMTPNVAITYLQNEISNNSCGTLIIVNYEKRLMILEASGTGLSFEQWAKQIAFEAGIQLTDIDSSISDMHWSPECELTINNE